MSIYRLVFHIIIIIMLIYMLCSINKIKNNCVNLSNNQNKEQFRSCCWKGCVNCGSQRKHGSRIYNSIYNPFIEPYASCNYEDLSKYNSYAT